MTHDLANKVAIVTGGGSGLGKAACLILARRGAAVVIGDIDEENGEATADDIRETAGRAVFVRADVSAEDDAKRLVETASTQFGGLDYAINNAGIDGEVLPLAEQSVATFRRVMDVNLLGVFLGMKYQIPAMLRRQGGAIVNVSSIAGLRGHPGIGPYAAAKHGVIGLTKTAAIEYGPTGLRVNALCPGGIRTPMVEKYFEQAPDYRATVIDGNPLRRLGEAGEMAEAAVWLCSPAASYVNGHDLVVDGGKIISTM